MTERPEVKEGSDAEGGGEGGNERVEQGGGDGRVRWRQVSRGLNLGGKRLPNGRWTNVNTCWTPTDCASSHVIHSD